MSPPFSAKDSDELEEARFRARMARVTSDKPPPRRRRPKEGADDASRGVRLGWKGWLLVDALVVFGTVAAVVLWPPVETCRAQEKSVGFYAGETLGACVRRGVSQRLTNADQRMKMLLRGSGH